MLVFARNTLSLLAVACALWGEVACAAPVLITPGGEPRTALAYTAQVGQTDTAVLQVTMAMTMTMAGVPAPPTALPPLKVGLQAECTAASTDGTTWTYTLTDAKLTGAEADPQVAQLNATAADMVGLTGTLSRNERGEITEHTPPAGKGGQLLQTVTQSLTAALVPVPAEPVGVGGSWTVTTELKQPSFMVQQVSTWTQTADGLTLDLSQTAPSGPIEVPDLPEGAQAELVTFRAAGSGTSVLNLSGLFPTRLSARQSVVTDTKVTLADPESEAPQVVHSGATVNLHVQVNP